jgi:hypothetical protein
LVNSRSSKEKLIPSEGISNIPQNTDIVVSIDKQQDKSNHSRREKEPGRDQDRREKQPSRDHDRREKEPSRDKDRREKEPSRDRYTSQNSSNRNRDREDYHHRYSGSRRQYSPPTSSRDRYHDRNDRNKGNFFLKAKINLRLVLVRDQKCNFFCV